MCAPTNMNERWNNINWSLCSKHVRRLQMRIVKAWQEKRYNKVKALQWMLTKSFSAKALAVKRVTGNKGGNTPGVDNVKWITPTQKYQAITQLTRKGYTSKPLRRIYIPKRNKSEKRPLGIPTLKDRAMQALYMLALEPIAETTADNCSYGFRPQRSTHDAIEHCFKLLSKKCSPEWILEGDIKGCFDNISHEWLMENIPMDKKILSEWLKSGMIFNGEWFPTEAGTPQGGIISPTLANMALDGLEILLRSKFKQKNLKGKMWNPKVKLVRYADDFIITGETKEMLENTVKPMVQNFLLGRGLKLSDSKTKITHINNGFDFLGQNIRSYKGKLLIKPSVKNIENILSKISEIINSNKQCRQNHLILKLNPVIKGWCEYHKYVVSSQIFYKLDHLIWLKLWRWCMRRHPHKGKRWIQNKYFKNIKGRSWIFAVEYDKDAEGNPVYLKLQKAGDVKIQRHTMINYRANPFDHQWDLYFEERAGLKMVKNESKRKFLIRLWKDQKGLCKYCSSKIDKTSGWSLHIDNTNSDKGKNTKHLIHPRCHRYIHCMKPTNPKLVLES